MNVMNSQSSEVLGRCVSQDLFGVSVKWMGRRPHFRSIVGFFELRTMGLEIVFGVFWGAGDAQNDTKLHYQLNILRSVFCYVTW